MQYKRMSYHKRVECKHYLHARNQHEYWHRGWKRCTYWCIQYWSKLQLQHISNSLLGQRTSCWVGGRRMWLLDVGAIPRWVRDLSFGLSEAVTNTFIDPAEHSPSNQPKFQTIVHLVENRSATTAQRRVWEIGVIQHPTMLRVRLPEKSFRIHEMRCRWRSRLEQSWSIAHLQVSGSFFCRRRTVVYAFARRATSHFWWRGVLRFWLEGAPLAESHVSFAVCTVLYMVSWVWLSWTCEDIEKVGVGFLSRFLDKGIGSS